MFLRELLRGSREFSLFALRSTDDKHVATKRWSSNLEFIFYSTNYKKVGGFHIS